MAKDMVRLNTRVSSEVMEWLDKKSERTGIPKSTLVYLALEQYMRQDVAVTELPKMMEQLQLLQNINQVK